MRFTDQQIFELDVRYANEGVPLHARPFRAAMDLLGNDFATDNPELNQITTAYHRLVPETQVRPGIGLGFAAVNDQIRRVVARVLWGGPHEISIPKALSFSCEADWLAWCRNDRQTIAQAVFAVADALDFAYGTDEMARQRSDRPNELWGLSTSNCEAMIVQLQLGHQLSALVQPICLSAELALKAALVRMGVPERELARRVNGHHLPVLAERLARERPYWDDALVRLAAERVPDYVEKRYNDAQLRRLDFIKLALGSQFIMASTVRRFDMPDHAKLFEQHPDVGQRSLPS